MTTLELLNKALKIEQRTIEREESSDTPDEYEERSRIRSCAARAVRRLVKQWESERD